MNTQTKPLKAKAGKRVVEVTNPNGVEWAVRYKDVDAAWSRVLCMYGLPNTVMNQKHMKKKGWKVEIVE